MGRAVNRQERTQSQADPGWRTLVASFSRSYLCLYSTRWSFVTECEQHCRSGQRDCLSQGPAFAPINRQMHSTGFPLS